jgi:hypothetical protein
MAAPRFKMHFERISIAAVKEIVEKYERETSEKGRTQRRVKEKERTPGGQAGPGRFSMTPQFDIFRMEGGDSVLWLEAAATLQDARNRVQQLAAQDSAEYLILDHGSGEKHIVKPQTMPGNGHAGAESASGNGPESFRFPQWEKPYREALGENDTQSLLQKVNAAEAAIFHRLQELRNSPDGNVERTAIQDALKALLEVKTEKLKFPGLSRSASQSSANPTDD